MTSNTTMRSPFYHFGDEEPPSAGFLSGTIESVHSNFGAGLVGYIRPDRDIDEPLDREDELIFFNRSSLRVPSAYINEKDRVFFIIRTGGRTQSIASDVHHIPMEFGQTSKGTVFNIDEARGFGIVKLLDGRKAFFHFNYLADPKSPPPIKEFVSCRVFQTQKGLHASDIQVEQSDVGFIKRTGPAYGFIERESGFDLYFARQDLRNANWTPKLIGTPVRFRIDPMPDQEYDHARDVTIIEDEDLEAPTRVTSRVPREKRYKATGIVSKIDALSKYGFIKIEDTPGDVYFNFGDLKDKKFPPELGAKVIVDCVESDGKVIAARVEVVKQKVNRKGSARKPDGDFGSKFAQAVLAEANNLKDAGNFDEAKKKYEIALEKFPSLQLVLNYAAMLRASGDLSAALKVYQRGIAVLPETAKIFEDAAALCWKELRRFPLAIEYLNRALTITAGRESHRKHILLCLAQAYYAKGDTEDSLPDIRKAVEFYIEAKKASEFDHSPMPVNELKQFSIAEVRAQHHRGNLAYRFFSRAGFKVVEANIAADRTNNADFYLQFKSEELAQSYGIEGGLLLRCMFKSEISIQDLQHLEATVRKEAPRRGLDESVALICVGSVNASLEKGLFQRIQEKQRFTDSERDTPAIVVPISQENIEKTPDGEEYRSLSAVLSKWLYKRDLFATNDPVQGDMFFGRKGPIAEIIEERIPRNQFTAIFGLRRSGKTSLLKNISARATESGDVVLYLDALRSGATEFKHVRWLYWTLAEQMAISAPKELMPENLQWRLAGRFRSDFDLQQDPKFPVGSAFTADLEEVLRAFRERKVSPKPRIIIIIDEVDRLLPNPHGHSGFEKIDDFFSFIRGLNQEGERICLIVSSASRWIASRSFYDGRDNPVFKFIRELDLEMLKPDECGNMMVSIGRGMNVKFSSDSQERIYGLTGGHPYLTRQLCSYICNQFEERPLEVSLEKIDRIINDFLYGEADDLFSEIDDRLQRDFPESRMILRELAQHQGAVGKFVAAPEGDEAVRHLAPLVAYGLIKTDERTHGLYFGMELMKTWLLRNYVGEQL